MIRGMYHKCERLGRTYFGMCHAGLGEYVVPIFDGDVLLGSINAGFFQSNEGKTTRRICRACRQEPPLRFPGSDRVANGVSDRVRRALFHA